MSTVDVPSLTPNQINALVVLMVEARELTNNELRDLAGFALTGADNAKLVKEGLVSTDRSHRPYSHELTEKGWRVVRTLHTSAPPRRGGSATRSMFTVLANVHRSLDRLRISQPDFFTQTTTGAPAAAVRGEDANAEQLAPPFRSGPDASRSLTAGDIESLVRAAYRSLASSPGDWVGLADLREHLDGVRQQGPGRDDAAGVGAGGGAPDRTAVDEALRALARRDGVRIIPVANSKALTPRDRAAALRIGDEENHALSIGSA